MPWKIAKQTIHKLRITPGPSICEFLSYLTLTPDVYKYFSTHSFFAFSKVFSNHSFIASYKQIFRETSQNDINTKIKKELKSHIKIVHYSLFSLAFFLLFFD